MLMRRNDLPLQRDALGGFLPWLIAFMVFLAILASAGALALTGLAERWDRGLSATLTIEIAPRIASDGTVKPVNADDMGAVLRTVRETEGVVSAAVVSEDRIFELLEPWLGAGADTAGLPLPALIDVTIDPERLPDISGLSRRLAAAAPGVSVDDHRLWLERLLRMFRAIEVLAVFIVGFVALATVGTVIFTTRTGLTVHGDVIEVLHLIGAHDRYIARQFSRRALWLGMQGGAIGCVLAAPALYGLSEFIADAPIHLAPDLRLTGFDMTLLAMVPAFVALLAMVTARVTVMRTLGRML
ncbi:MAG: cell division protein FtsX [Rhodospirillales bacterium]